MGSTAAGPVSFLPMGDRGVRVDFSETFHGGLPDIIRSWCRALERARIPGVVEWVPGFTSVAISYDPVVILFGPLCTALAALTPEDGARTENRRRLLVPVAYGGEPGPDLAAVARRAGMSEEEVIRRHSAPSYRVVMIGFAPGFPYLSGLDPALAMPRRDQPRVRVPAGSVGIGGAQTGVYTRETPGGWHIIGRTPVRFFDSRRDPPSLLAPADEVRFVPVNAEELRVGESEVAAGRWSPTWEPVA